MASNTSNLKRSYYVHENTPDAQQRGPFHPTEIKDLIEAKALNPDCLIASDNKPEWVPLSEHPIKPIVAPEKRKLALRANAPIEREAPSSVTAESIVQAAMSEEQKETRERVSKIKAPTHSGTSLFGFLGQLGLSFLYFWNYAGMCAQAAFSEDLNWDEAATGWSNPVNYIVPLAYVGRPFVKLLELTPDAGMTALIIVISGIVIAGYSLTSPRYNKLIPMIVWMVMGVPLYVLSTQIFAFLAMPIYVMQNTAVGAGFAFYICYRYLKSREYA